MKMGGCPPSVPTQAGVDGTLQAQDREIKGVLFDIDGTLYHAFPLRACMAMQLIFAWFSNPSKILRTWKVIRCFRMAQEVLRKRGAISTPCERQVRLAAERAGEAPAVVEEVIANWFYRRPLPFLYHFRRRGLRSVFRSLTDQGFLLGVFSDYPAQDKIGALGIADWLTAAVSSCDPGVSGFKPYSTGFLVAAQKMGVRPSELIYVGDRPAVDGKGGTAAGLKVVIVGRGGWRFRPDPYPRVRALAEIVEVALRYG